MIGVINMENMGQITVSPREWENGAFSTMKQLRMLIGKL
jgi:hypothetical protein